MAAQAVFAYGNVTTVMEYTPSGADVEPGQVVPIGDNIVGIATQLIPDGELGGLNVQGGVYNVTGDAVIAIGAVVYWVDSSNKVSETGGSGSNLQFGFVTKACGGNGQICEVYHQPGVN